LIDFTDSPKLPGISIQSHRKINRKLATAIGVGAIDDFSFGVPKNHLRKEYVLRSNPLINQWNYTVGFR
jgi:hypothetical protein